jgi:hypothetical protein
MLPGSSPGPNTESQPLMKTIYIKEGIINILLAKVIADRHKINEGYVIRTKSELDFLLIENINHKLLVNDALTNNKN